MENGTDYGFFSKDAAGEIGINTNTLRTWSLKLEEQGVEFSKKDDKKNSPRIYYKNDIILLKKFKDVLDKTKSMKTAVETLVSLFQEAKTTGVFPKTAVVFEDDSDEKIEVSKNELKTLIQSSVADAIEKEREAMFKAFESKMNSVIETRDLQLTRQLNDTLEQKKLEIAAAEEKETTLFDKLKFWKERKRG